MIFNKLLILLRNCYLFSRDCKLRTFIVKILRSTYRSFLFICDTFIFLFRPIHHDNTILFIRLDNIGDFIAWLGAAQEMSNYYNNSKRILIANDTFYELASKIGYWDEVWVVNRDKFGTNIIYRLNVLYRVRKYGFSILINPRRELRITDSIVRVSGAKKRIGSNGCETFRHGKWEIALSDYWYTDIVKLPSRISSSVFQHHFEFCSQIGINLRCLPLGIIPSSCDEKPICTEKLPTNYCVFFIGASQSIRKWPAEKFAETISYIWDAFDLKSVLCGGSQDIDISDKIIALTADNSIINLTGKTNLLQLLYLIRRAKLCISNETCAIQIAASTGCQSICILGGGDFGYFVPYPNEIKDLNALPYCIYNKIGCFNCAWDCIYEIKNNFCSPCIDNVPVEDVIKIACKLLNK